MKTYLYLSLLFGLDRWMSRYVVAASFTNLFTVTTTHVFHRFEPPPTCKLDHSDSLNNEILWLGFYACYTFEMNLFSDLK